MTVGFRCHSGWAVMVAVAGSERRPVLLDRRRVELVCGPQPRQPYHAVAEEGAPPTVVADVERERAVIEAGGDLGLRVHVLRPDAIRVGAAVDALRRSVGPPWQKDHKWATEAALAALTRG